MFYEKVLDNSVENSRDDLFFSKNTGIHECFPEKLISKVDWKNMHLTLQAEIVCKTLKPAT